MKGINILCASTATANDERGIHCHKPIIKDGRRSFTAPCSSGNDYISPYRKITRIPSLSSSSGCKISEVDKGRRNNSGSLLKIISSQNITKTPHWGPDPVITEGGEPSKSIRGYGVVEEKKKMTSGSDKVVVLRGSLHCHCRGCEGKMKKLLSRMQGVTSFNIDFASKKVTVTGEITPLDVLGCLSKVKNAQFWISSQSSVHHSQDQKRNK